jgi:hypothetical protein
MGVWPIQQPQGVALAVNELSSRVKVADAAL